jgi:hypothetical protein
MAASAEPATPGDPFGALGDAHRRQILTLIAEGPRSVRALADELPISRPAVSRHLRLLREAGLVSEEPEGNRRIDRLRRGGMEAMQVDLQQVWGEAATRFRLVAENTTPDPPATPAPAPAPGAAGSRDDRAPADRPRGRMPARPRLLGRDRAVRTVVAPRPYRHRRPGRPARAGLPAKDGTLEAWARSETNPVGGWYGLRKGYRGHFAMYIPPLLEHLGLVELEHNPRNNRIRAR